MPHDDIVYIKHARDAAKKALEFIKGRDRRDLDTDEMLALSLVRLLEVVGEAANLVSKGHKEENPKIPWTKMTGMRNRLIHGYFDINLDIVWDTVVKDLPPLITDFEKMIEESEDG